MAWASTVDIDPAAAPRHIRAQLLAQGHVMRFELITQVRPEEIVVVGLAGYGVRLFTVRQTAQNVVIESAASRELEFVAEWLMDALHRSFWIEPTARDESGAGIWGRERVIDSPPESTGAASTMGREWRRFELRGKDSATEPVTIAYPGFDGEARDPRTPTDSTLAHDTARDRKATLQIRNPWCGYEAILAPLE